MTSAKKVREHIREMQRIIARRDFIMNRDVPQVGKILTGNFESFTALLAHLAPGSRVLEVGMGQGEALKQLARRFPHLKFFGTNLHYSEAKPTNVKQAVNAEASALPFKKNSFDFVYSVHTWQYVPDKAKFLEEVHRVLKPRAVALIHTNFAESNFRIERKRQNKRYRVRPFEFLARKGIEKTIEDVLKVQKKRRALNLGLQLDHRKSRVTDARNFISAYRVKR